MSVAMGLTVFEKEIPLKSDIRSYRFEFLVENCDEYYHLQVLNVSFGYDTTESKAFDVDSKNNYISSAID